MPLHLKMGSLPFHFTHCVGGVNFELETFVLAGITSNGNGIVILTFTSFHLCLSKHQVASSLLVPLSP